MYSSCWLCSSYLLHSLHPLYWGCSLYSPLSLYSFYSPQPTYTAISIIHTQWHPHYLNACYTHTHISNNIQSYGIVIVIPRSLLPRVSLQIAILLPLRCEEAAVITHQEVKGGHMSNTSEGEHFLLWLKWLDNVVFLLRWLDNVISDYQAHCHQNLVCQRFERMVVW